MEIRGFVRRYLHGELSYDDARGTLLVTAPDKQEWRFPITLDETSGFYIHFDAKTKATGDYSVSFAPEHENACGGAGFKKEAYRLPTFEVLLNAAEHVPLDAPFQVGLLARYYAGGVVTARPIKWRVSQFPYAWTPNTKGREGFLFSSDARFSAEQDFRSTPVLQSEGKTDAGGSAQLTLDPTLEPTAQPRTYAVEATVTGDDGQQIRSVSHVAALPPFVLGLKTARYVAHPGAIAADLIALDADGKPRAGIDMTVRLVKRDWNSVLEASDFSQGTREIRHPGPRPHRRGTPCRQHRCRADAEFRRGRCRRLAAGGFRRRPAGAAADAARRSVHGRRHAGDLAARAGENRDADHRQARLRARRDGHGADRKPVPDGARAGGDGAAGRPVRLPVGRCRPAASAATRSRCASRRCRACRCMCC